METKITYGAKQPAASVRLRSRFQEIVYKAQAQGAGRLTLRRMTDDIGDRVSVDFLHQLINDDIKLLNLDRAAAVCFYFGITLSDLFVLEQSQDGGQTWDPVDLFDPKELGLTGGGGSVS